MRVARAAAMSFSASLIIFSSARLCAVRGLCVERGDFSISSGKCGDNIPSYQVRDVP